MTEQQQHIEPVDRAFEWPASEPPHPHNLALATKICRALLPEESNTTTATTHFPSGWSSYDVIQVSISSSSHQRRFIVKLPRRRSSSCIAVSCKAEALRTSWAAKHDLGPNVLATDEERGGFAMEYLEGRTLTIEMIRQRLPQAVSLLRRIHEAEPTHRMRRYDPMEVVRQHIKRMKGSNAMQPNDISLVEAIIRNAEEQVKDHPWVPCHNDFHSHNIMLVDTERLLAIDFEDCDLGDPMWDLAYLTVNLELEREPYYLEHLYGASAEDRGRVRAYIPLAMAHCATWAALHGELWAQHQKEVMERLGMVVVDLN